MATTTTTPGISLRQLADREERVFPTYPQVARYFPAASIEDARHRLGRAIERGDGPGLIIGGPGTGKSLLLQVLASQYHEKFDVVLPACARLCTRRALLQSILFELGLPYRVRDEGDLRLSLLDHLLSREECPTGLLLLVDEAQTLSTGLLDELRVLTNLVRGGMPRVRLVLAGSSALEESFAHPDLESFSQRLAARCYIGPFGREETAQFVRAQVAACGASPDELFSKDAWEALFEATDGVPRLVNQLCDRAVVQAIAASKARVDRPTIQTAWADIQQLPAPWETPAPTTAPPAPLQVVEFGSLDDDPAEARRPAGEMLVVGQVEDEEAFDGELTELDCEENEAELAGGKIPAPQVSESPPARPLSEREGSTATYSSPKAQDSNSPLKNSVVGVCDPEIFGEEPASQRPATVLQQAATLGSRDGDPFGEEFDEEEVVLDNFASWDDMFRREAPRVQNRRDPEFAALVQAAITTDDVSEEVVSAPTGATFRMLDADIDEYEIATMDLLAAESTNAGEPTSWPPLRLAVLSDAALSLPIDLPQETDEADLWARSDSAHSVDDLENASIAEEDDEPVLIVEDDHPAPKSPVRREEYRNLFSRLRSG